MFKSHGIKNRLRQYVAGNICPVCFVDFHTRERLSNHLRYRSAVGGNHMLKQPPCSEEADELDAREKTYNCALAATGVRRHEVDRARGWTLLQSSWTPTGDWSFLYS